MKSRMVHLSGESIPPEEETRRPARPRGTFDWVTLLVAALALAGQMYMEATHNDKANAVAISALQSHREDDSKRLDHIENSLDEVLRLLRTTR